MKSKMIKTNLSAVRMTLSLIALISLEGACSMTPSNQDAQKNDKPQQHTDAPVTKGGTLSLTMPTDSKKRPATKLRISLVPSVLKLAATPDPGAVQQHEFDFEAGKVVEIDALQAGQYLMVVDLVDEKGQVIESGSAQNEIIAGQKQTAEVTLKTPAIDDLGFQIKSEKEFFSSAETPAKTPAIDDLSILIKSEKEFLSSAETPAKTPAIDDLGHPKQK